MNKTSGKTQINRRSIMKVSIVVPAYNVERFIDRCIQSLVQQTYGNLEIIVIDDGSTDCTSEVIKKYKKKDSRIIALSTDHLGPNMARSRGVNVANGDYIMFVDADDYLEVNAVEILIDKFCHTDVNIIRFNSVYRDSGKKVSPIPMQGRKQKIIMQNKIEEFLLTSIKLNALWSQIYKSDFLKGVEAFGYDISFGEDFLVNLEVYQKIDKMLILDDVLYHYCDNSKSITNTVCEEKIIKNVQDRIFVSNIASQYVSKNIKNVDFRNKAFYSQLRMLRHSFIDLCKIEKYTKKQFIENFNDVFTKNRFSMIDVGELSDYIATLSFSEKVKNEKFINPILELDYDYMWRYICCYRILKKIIRRGK